MTILGEISAKPELVVRKLKEHEDYLETSHDFFDMECKRLEELCMKHPEKLCEFKRKQQEIKSIEDLYKIKLDEEYGRQYKIYNEQRGKALSSSDIKAYISSTPEYVSIKEVLLEITYIRHQYDAVVEALEAMGYSLNNITKIRVADLENIVL